MQRKSKDSLNLFQSRLDQILNMKHPLSRWKKLWRRRRAAIEPIISHAKHDNRMKRNYLKGKNGDEINATLSACGYNIRKLMRAFFLPEFRAAILRLCQIFSPKLQFETGN